MTLYLSISSGYNCIQTGVSTLQYIQRGWGIEILSCSKLFSFTFSGNGMYSKGKVGHSHAAFSRISDRCSRIFRLLRKKTFLRFSCWYKIWYRWCSPPIRSAQFHWEINREFNLRSWSQNKNKHIFLLGYVCGGNADDGGRVSSGPDRLLPGYFFRLNHRSVRRCRLAYMQEWKLQCICYDERSAERIWD